MNILFLDDDLNRVKVAKPLFIGHSVTWCTTAKEAIDAISNPMFGFHLYSLDCDLDGQQMAPLDEKSGFAVVQHMQEIPIANLPEHVIIHSFNPVGSLKMQEFIWNMNERDGTEVTPIRALFGSDRYKDLLEKILNA